VARETEIGVGFTGEFYHGCTQ